MPPHCQRHLRGRIYRDTWPLAYGTAKGAVHGFTRSLSKESGEYGIHVNAVSPGALTRPVKASTNNFPDEAAGALSPELVAPTVARLAHPDTDVNGEVFTVMAGTTAQVAVVESDGFRDDARHVVFLAASRRRARRRRAMNAAVITAAAAKAYHLYRSIAA